MMDLGDAWSVVSAESVVRCMARADGGEWERVRAGAYGNDVGVDRG